MLRRAKFHQNWCKFWDYPQREFSGVYHFAKFGWNGIVVYNTKV